MSASITNRVILPDGGKMYVSDDIQGDIRLEQIYKKYGNCKIESCNKEFGGKSLDELESFWQGTIEEFFN